MTGKRRFFTHNFKIQAALGIRFEKIEGVEYMVAPCVAVREIVLNGILLPANEIEKFPEAWNGVPVPVGHPHDQSGWPVSAGTLDQLFRSAGWFFNVSVDSEDKSKVRGEVWIDILRATTMGGDVERAFSQIRNGYESEVSSAFYADIEDTQGTFDGVDYVGVFRNIVPDHLAILLDEPGACNREDGCGCPQSNSASEQKPGAALHIQKKENNNMDREIIIANLVACDCCDLDQAALTALSDEQLTIMGAMRDNFATIRSGLNEQIQTNAADQAAADQAAADTEDDDDDDDTGEVAVSIEQFTELAENVATLTEQVALLVTNIVDNQADERQVRIDRIVANSSLTAEMLKDMTVDALTALEVDLTPADYSGRAGPRPQANTGKTTTLNMPKVGDPD